MKTSRQSRIGIGKPVLLNLHANTATRRVLKVGMSQEVGTGALRRMSDHHLLSMLVHRSYSVATVNMATNILNFFFRVVDRLKYVNFS